MRKIFRLFALEWSKMLQYRTDIILWTTAELMTPLISLAVWYTVAQSSNQGTAASNVVTYYILVMFILIVTNSWNGFFFAWDILRGELSKDLIKPLNAFWKHIANNLVEKAIKLFLPIPSLIVVLVLFPSFFSPSIYSLSRLGLFAVSLLLAISLSFALDMIFGVVAFWLEDTVQLRQYKELLQEIASGLLIPFSFMPPLLFSLLSVLPFRFIISVPAEIIMGQVSGRYAFYLLGYQLLWVLALIIILAGLWRQGLKRYAAPGQ